MAGAYTHHAQHHNPMEMFATTVEWLGDGKKLTIYDKTQGDPMCSSTSARYSG
ncbi:MAG: hypothetical protein WKG07_32295 [Hymenobacter sp.]